MQSAELKAFIDAATQEDRLFMSAYLRIQSAGGQNQLGRSLAEAAQRIESGQSVSLEKARELHRQLESSGL